MSSSSNATISNCTATHIVGDTALDIAHGDLVLTTAESSNGGAGKTPVLTLSVGKAVFPLYKDTTFGTISGDERVYVFKPELSGESITGYIKIALPESAVTAGQDFVCLQEQFEQLLVERGLLEPAGQKSALKPRAVIIPSVTATHIVGKTETELGRGNLTLTSNVSSSTAGALTLTVGKAAFTLHKTTLFGTLAEDDLVYVFRPEVVDASVPTQQAYVKLQLSESIKSDPDASKLREQFEQILIDYGLLKEGIEAVGDELGRSVREDASTTAEAIRNGTTGFLHHNPPTNKHISFTEGTHKITNSGLSASQSLYSTAQSVSSTVTNAASSAGAWVSAHLGPSSPGTKDTLRSVADAFDAASDGVSAGALDVKDATKTAVGDIVGNEFGTDARVVGARLAGSAGNVTGAAGKVVGVGTGAGVAVAGVRGVVQTVDTQDGGPVTGTSAQELETFAKQERTGTGEWKEIPV